MCYFILLILLVAPFKEAFSLRQTVDDECGVPIFGHEYSTGAEYSGHGQWPWLASIFFNNSYYCGSSLISKKHLLSAAHCVHSKNKRLPLPTDLFYAYLGRYDLNNDNDPNSVRVKFADIYVHDDWNWKGSRYIADIAIFLMKSEIQFTRFILPICLPRESARVFNVEGTVAGFGLTEYSLYHENRTKHIEIKSVDNEKCFKIEQSLSSLSSPETFCAGMNGKSPCQGDSGSPFMVKIGRKWTLNGIVSVAANKKCQDNDFVLFTQVPSFLNWINNIVDECGKKKFKETIYIPGDYSYPGQWPWLAALYKREKFNCGASIINRNHLLSAAHCVQQKGENDKPSTSNYHGILGRHDLNHNEDANSIRVDFSRIYVHPEWDFSLHSFNFDADIALLRMNLAVEFNEYIQPICLPSKNTKNFDVVGTIVGYGTSDSSNTYRYKHVETQSVEHAACIIKEKIFSAISSERMFCAAIRKNRPCRGDGGGPFMVKKDEQWRINGITSVIANPNCDNDRFASFTQVSKYTEWIRNILEEDHPLECNYEHIWDKQNFDIFCSTSYLKILHPNLKISSITGELSSSINPRDAIEKILIKNTRVHYLPDISIANNEFPKFKKLEIKNSELKTLDKNQLALLPQLTSLEVPENKITELPETVIEDLTELETFNFNNNQVRVLPQKLLWNVRKLRIFKGSNNQVQEIPTNFFKNNGQIKEIYLNNNKIYQIGANFKSLTELTVVDLKGNECIDKRATKDFDRFQSKVNDECEVSR